MSDHSDDLISNQKQLQGNQTDYSVQGSVDPAVINQPKSTIDRNSKEIVIADISMAALQPIWSLTDENQVIINKYNLRVNETINEDAEHKYEIIDISKRILLKVERMPPPYDSESSCLFRLYSRDNNCIIEMINPSSNLFMCCGTSCSPCQRCNFKAVVSCPPGNIIGYINRQRSCCLQEFEILNSDNQPLLTLKGCPRDFQLYPLDLSSAIGRISVRWWRGVMHEIRRSENDIGVTFPIDLDIRAKVLIICSAFAIDWIYPEHQTNRHRWQEGENVEKFDQEKYEKLKVQEETAENTL